MKPCNKIFWNGLYMERCINPISKERIVKRKYTCGHCANGKRLQRYYPNKYNPNVVLDITL